MSKFRPNCNTNTNQTFTNSELKSDFPGGLIQGIGTLPTLDRNNSFDDINVSWNLDQAWLKDKVAVLKRNNLIPELIPPVLPSIPTLPPVPQQPVLPQEPVRPNNPSVPIRPPPKSNGNYTCTPNVDHGGSDIACFSTGQTPADDEAMTRCDRDPNCKSYNSIKNNDGNRWGCIKTQSTINNNNNPSIVNFCVKNASSTNGIPNVSYIQLGYGADYINLSQIVGKDINGNNVTKGRPTTGPEGWGGITPNAVDGNEMARPYPGVYHSSGGNQYIEVTLDKPTTMASATVYNRTDCCSGRMTGHVVKFLDSRKNVLWTSPPLKDLPSQTVGMLSIQDIVIPNNQPDAAQLQYTSDMQTYNDTVRRNNQNYNTLLSAYNTNVNNLQNTYQSALNNYRDIYNRIVALVKEYNNKAKVFNDTNTKYKKFVNDQYCFYKNMLAYADNSLFKTQSNLDVVANNPVGNNKFNMVQNLKYKMVVLKEIAELTFVDNVKLLSNNIPPVLEGFMGRPARDSTSEDINDQYHILTKETERGEKNKRLIEYTIEKNKATQNLLTLFGVLNVVALGIIYKIASS